MTSYLAGASRCRASPLTSRSLGPDCPRLFNQENSPFYKKPPKENDVLNTNQFLLLRDYRNRIQIYQSILGPNR